MEVTGDPLSLKCREHRDELKLFCMEEKVPVCCLCVLVGMHKNHKASQLQEACAHFKVNASIVVSLASVFYFLVNVVVIPFFVRQDIHFPWVCYISICRVC